MSDAGKRGYDVIVVGGGVAGMAAALWCAERGRRVAMVDPRAGAAFRVGESLDWEAPMLFGRLGFSLDDWVANGTATEKTGVVVSSATCGDAPLAIGFSWTYRMLMALVGRNRPTAHVDRDRLDAALLDRAAAFGVEVYRERVSKVVVEARRVAAVRLGDGRELTGRLYVDASGRAGVVRRALSIGVDATGPRKVVLRARFRHPYDGRGTRIRTDDGLGAPAWIWDIHVAADTTDVGLVLVQEDFARLLRRCGSRAAVFAWCAARHADLGWIAPLVDEATGFWTCVFQDYVARETSGDNWILVGESAFVVDALLSSGVTTSLRSAFAAASIIDHALDRSDASCAATLDPVSRAIYHRKASAQVHTVNRLLDLLWYRGRIRERFSLKLNVLSILAVNFNLNHLHTRWNPRTMVGLRALLAVHRLVDWGVERYAAALDGDARARPQNGSTMAVERKRDALTQTPP